MIIASVENVNGNHDLSAVVTVPIRKNRCSWANRFYQAVKIEVTCELGTILSNAWFVIEVTCEFEHHLEQCLVNIA